MSRFGPPLRRLLYGQVLTSTGAGVLTTATVVYLVQSVGLDAIDVGVGLAAAGLAGLAPLPAVGALVDRYGARPVALAGGTIATVATGAFICIGSLPTFIVLEAASTGAFQAIHVAQRTIAGQLLTGQDRVQYVAWNRVAANLGVALGALAAAPALVLNDQRVYVVTYISAAAAVAAAAACMWNGAGPAPFKHDNRQRPWAALTDLRYMVMALLCGLLTTRHRVLTAAVPLWIVTATVAPPGVNAALLVVNAGMVILLQVRVSAGADTLQGATRVVRLGGIAFAAAFTCIVLAGALPRWPAAALLLVAAIPFTFGEMWTSAASWTYSYELAPPYRIGSYQAAFALGRLVGEVVGPLLVVLTALGAAGWIAVTLLFLVCCALTGAAAPWAAHDRHWSAPV